jgi:hypothetical protein
MSWQDLSSIVWENLYTIFNSAFMTSLIGAMSGALAGAYMAQRIADKANESERLLKQIRATNAAITMAFTICNSFIQLKRQHVKPLYTQFNEEAAAHQAFLRKHCLGEISPDKPFSFSLDFRLLQIPLFHIDALKRFMFETLSVSGRPVVLTAQLASTIDSVKHLMETRSKFIETFKSNPPKDTHQALALYFGLPYGEGKVSTEYKDTLEGLDSQVDCGIFFSSQLCRDLNTFGEGLLSKYKRLSRSANERINEADFSLAESEGLMPEDSKFADWNQAFKKSEVA